MPRTSTMQIEASYNAYPDLLAEFRHNHWLSSYPDRGAIRTDWDSPFINGYNRFFNLCPDLKIHNWNQTFLDTFEMVERGTDPVPVILICLVKGHLQATYQDSTYHHDICLKAGHNLLMFSGLGKRGVWTCPYGVHSQTVEVVIDVQRLAAYLGPESAPDLAQFRHLLCQHAEQPYFHGGIITPEMQMVLHQYLHCPYQGVMQRLYLESKAVELVVLKLAQIQQMAQESNVGKTNGSPKRSLKAQDMARVHHAREILLNDMAHPPSLQRLAEQVGIGDYKLKQDFRIAFGMSVFAYLRSHRLEQARQLLASQHMGVSEAARFVGYSSLSKFTAAFKRQFGIVPSACLGKRLDRS
ncbi:MAG: AraC family transcriptional regulator [Cyanobacteria bacterium J06635_15]